MLLKFTSNDTRDLLDILIAANVSGDAPDAVEIDGKVHDLRHLWKLLPYEEALQSRHQAEVDNLFDKRQWGYGRTANNLWHRHHSAKVSQSHRRAETGQDLANDAEAPVPDEQTVDVRRQWNDWKIASYRLSDVDGLHWDSVSGGVKARAPRSFLHGYVWCDGMIEGELSHSCRHGAGPHRIKVCITKRGNEAAFGRLVELAECAKPVGKRK
jgi:hypothetical protein